MSAVDFCGNCENGTVDYNGAPLLSSARQTLVTECLILGHYPANVIAEKRTPTPAGAESAWTRRPRDVSPEACPARDRAC